MNFVVGMLENQFTAGAVTAVLLGAAIAALRNIPVHFANLIVRWLVVRVDVADHDPAFFWLQGWLATHPYTARARAR